jgi:arylsulfatase A-like enzyme
MATSPWTLPSHGSMLTGMYPNRIGLTAWGSLPLTGAATLASMLKTHGFATAAVVNSYLLTSRYGLQQGFDDFLYLRENLKRKAPSKVGRKAVSWFQIRRSKPFFLFLHYYDIHSDYSSLPQFESQFLRPYEGVADGTTTQLLNFRNGLVKLTKVDAEHLIDLYDASIKQMDFMLAQLFKYLEKQKLADNTVVIVTSDHGEELFDHGGVLHSQTQYEELVHIPLIIRGPGIPQSKRIKQIVSLVDFMPTILSLAGVDAPASLDGTNLCPLWQDSNARLPQRHLFAEASKTTIPEKIVLWHDIKRAVRHPRYKLHYDKLTKKAELYDLQDDPLETNDVASNHTVLVDSMFSQLKKFMGTSRKTEVHPLSPEEVQRLKSLGYL